MGDPIRTYLDSVNNLERVAADAKRMISVVVGVASALQQNPLRVMFSNAAIGMPMDVAFGRSATANARDWPTADQIQQALAQWHHARAQVSQAWNTVPPNDRNSLRPPPTA
jgi:hypothetical protein